MRPTSIFLARHGETDWNRAHRWQGQTDVPLNAAGRQQAADLGRTLQDMGIQRIVTSNLARARETGQIIARELGVPFEGEEAGLRERTFGVFEGLTREEVSTRFPEKWALYQKDRRNTPPGGEPLEHLVARVSQVVVAQLSQPTTLLVTHGGCMRSLWATHDATAVRPLHNAAVMRFDVTQRAGALQIHRAELLQG